jgi:hypothetical protein
VAITDADRPYRRLPGESAQAFAAFTVYAELGADRSLDAVARKLDKSRSLLGRWAARWDWVARARAWDDHRVKVERAAADTVAADRAAERERRRQEAEDGLWERAKRLAAKADEMLEAPLYSERTSKDGQAVIIEPAKWTLQTAAIFLKLAAELEAASLQLSPPEDDGFDPFRASPEECREYLERKGIKAT